LRRSNSLLPKLLQRPDDLTKEFDAAVCRGVPSDLELPSQYGPSQIVSG
jgi:hypothetical protein